MNVSNLISNAVKFTPAGGRVVVRTALRDHRGGSTAGSVRGVGSPPEAA